SLKRYPRVIGDRAAPNSNHFPDGTCHRIYARTAFVSADAVAEWPCLCYFFFPRTRASQLNAV
ncbi:MAG: hypothetical protein K2Z80_31145, partial [Xanthobacteraceae bacterium]|nr:hypothetical protein [Xanthobacteraceae bacterium]